MNLMTWKAAETACIAVFSAIGRQGELLSVESNAEFGYIKSLLDEAGYGGKMYWTSGRYKEGWRWGTTGELVPDFAQLSDNWGDQTPPNHRLVISTVIRNKVRFEALEGSEMERYICKVVDGVYPTPIPTKPTTERPTPPPFFIPSTEFTDASGKKKVFLVAKPHTHKKGNWYQNKEMCKEHGVEMVSIHSAAEDAFFHTFIRSPDIKMNAFPFGPWLGARIYDLSREFTWENGKFRNYIGVVQPGEFNEPGNTCLHFGYANTRTWWNDYCYHEYYWMTCQMDLN